MTPAPHRDGRAAKLLRLSAAGRLSHLDRGDLARLFRPGDLVVANDAATLPASLSGRHAASGAPVELRLAAWASPGDPRRFIAVAFGAGDWRTRTEDRPPPPRLYPGDMLALGPLLAIVEDVLDAPRLIRVRFAGAPDAVWEGIVRHGRPVQYSHVREPLAPWDIVDLYRRATLRLRAAVGGFFPRLAPARRASRARHRVCHAHPRRRTFFHRRPHPRRKIPARRGVPHSRRHRPAGYEDEGRRRARHRHRHDRRAGARSCGQRRPRRASGRRHRHRPHRPEDEIADRRRDPDRRASAGREPLRAAARLRRRRGPRRNGRRRRRRAAIAITSSAISC